MLTEDSLSVFWHFEDGQEEVAGILVYGYFSSEKQETLLFPYDLWPSGTLVDTYVYVSDTDEAWHIVEWTIKVEQWPEASEWVQVLEGTLFSLITQGAKVAWCGLEGLLSTPPALFSPLEMSGSLYALLIPRHKFVCSAHLGKPFQAISDEELLKAEMIIKIHERK